MGKMLIQSDFSLLQSMTASGGGTLEVGAILKHCCSSSFTQGLWTCQVWPF